MSHSIDVVERRGGWATTFTVGVQTFDVYQGASRERADRFARMLGYAIDKVVGEARAAERNRMLADVEALVCARPKGGAR